MSDTDPPPLPPMPDAPSASDQQFYMRLLVEPLVKELRLQTQLQRQTVEVLRDLKEELSFLRKSGDRLARLEHLIKTAVSGG